MKKYQVWIGGSTLFDTEARNAREALQHARDWLGVKRLPNGTGVCEISSDYYDRMAKNNREIGIDISNM